MHRRFQSKGVLGTCVLLAALVGMAGCGVKRIPTAGTVTLDGEPMPEGILQFFPDPTKGNNLRLGCMGPISNGRWNLVTTGMERADTGAGAPVGWFKVTYTHPTEGIKGAAPAPKVADKFRMEVTTPISIELTDPPPAAGYKIELTSK